MRNYQLHFEDDGLGEAKVIEFRASYPGDAFQHVMREKPNRKAVLWEGDRRIGTLSCMDDGLWSIEG